MNVMGTATPPCSAESLVIVLCAFLQKSQKAALGRLQSSQTMDSPFGATVRFILHRFKSTQSLTAAQCLVLYSPWIHTELINPTCHSRGRQHLCHQPGAVWLCSATIPCPSGKNPTLQRQGKASPIPADGECLRLGPLTGTDSPEEIWDEQNTILFLR